MFDDYPENMPLPVQARVTDLEETVQHLARIVESLKASVDKTTEAMDTLYRYAQSLEAQLKIIDTKHAIKADLQKARSQMQYDSLSSRLALRHR